MARPNKQRDIDVEEAFAQRVELERKKRDLSYEGLAKLMTAVGCAIQPSAIQKIEKAKPRRRIVVNEAVAFAIVFGIPIEELLTPRSVRLDLQLNKAIADGPGAYSRVISAKHDYEAVIARAVEALTDQDSGGERLALFWETLTTVQKTVHDVDDSIIVRFLEEVLKALPEDLPEPT
jgi:transcriptional regulator with XRE-family HTH domain